MGFMSDLNRLMKVATKPDRREIWLVIRVTALGMGGLGLIGFLIKLTGDVIFQGVHNSSTTTATTSAVLQLAQPLLSFLLLVH